MSDRDTIRLDKWLWQARFFKSRTIASRLCVEGRIRVDGVPVDKAHHALRVGNVLTFPQVRRIRVVRVRALGERRGPAAEARTLYDDLADAPPLPRPTAFIAALATPGANGRS
jgi:ribosome-associated heat shock protein Hsp15